MAISDHLPASIKQRVKIFTCDPPTRRIEGVTRDGAMIQISVFDDPTRWPVQDEIWSIERQNYDWTLVAPVQLNTGDADQLLWEDLEPGDAIIGAAPGQTTWVTGPLKDAAEQLALFYTGTPDEDQVPVWDGDKWVSADLHGLPAGGTPGQAVINTAPGTGIWQTITSAGVDAYAMATGGSPVAIANGGITTLANIPAFTANTGPFVRNVAGYVTVTEAGLYAISASVQWQNVATGNRRFVRITLGAVDSNTGVIADDERPPMNASGFVTHNVGVVIYLAANAIVSIFPYQDSGGAMNATVEQFGIAKLGVGQTGPIGLTGLTGGTGSTGTAGSVWRSGTGAPSGALGVVTDWYLNDANGDIYEKTGVSTYTLRDNLTGPTGATGSAGGAGPTGPAGSNGVGFPVSVVTAFPGSGTTGDVVALSTAAMAAKGIIWMFRYNSAAATYKWEFIGGPAWIETIDTDQTTTSTTFADLTTAGPQVTLPGIGGDFNCEWDCDMSVLTPVSPAENGYVGLADNGTVGANSYAQITMNTDRAGNASKRRVLTSVTASHVLKVMYRTNGGGTTHFARRNLSVTPIRCI